MRAELSPEEMDEIRKRLLLVPVFEQSMRKLKQVKSMKEAVEAFEEERRFIKEGGGSEAIEMQHKQGKLTARERLEMLFDPGTFQELDAWHRPYESGFDIGEERGRGDGVVVGYGQVMVTRLLPGPRTSLP